MTEREEVYLTERFTLCEKCQRADQENHQYISARRTITYNNINKELKQ